MNIGILNMSPKESAFKKINGYQTCKVVCLQCVWVKACTHRSSYACVYRRYAVALSRFTLKYTSKKKATKEAKVKVFAHFKQRQKLSPHSTLKPLLVL